MDYQAWTSSTWGNINTVKSTLIDAQNQFYAMFPGGNTDVESTFNIYVVNGDIQRMQDTFTATVAQLQALIDKVNAFNTHLSL